MGYDDCSGCPNAAIWQEDPETIYCYERPFPIPKGQELLLMKCDHEGDYTSCMFYRLSGECRTEPTSQELPRGGLH